MTSILNKTGWLCLCLIALAISSCTKILDEELTQPDPKLVVNGVINPDSSIKINLSKSVPIFANESSVHLPFVEAAAVKLFQDQQFLFNLQEDAQGYYSNPDFMPSLNHTYSIEVEKSGFTPVHAEAKIPLPVLITSFDTTLVLDNYEDYFDIHMECNLKYNDPPGITNYYRLECFYILSDEQGQEYVNRQYLYVDENDSYLFDKTDEYLLWNDVLTNGDEVNIKFNIYLDYFETDTTGITYVVMLNSVSEDFYKYDKTRSIYNESGGSDNPFSEPVVIYTNIENGRGIFGAYSSDTASFNYIYTPQFQNQ